MWTIVYDCELSRVMSATSTDYHPSVIAPYKLRLMTESGQVKYEGYTDEMNYLPLEEYGQDLGCEVIEYWDPESEEWTAL